MPLSTFNIELVNSHMLTPAVKHLCFKRQDGEPFDFIPGQFITLLIDTPEKVLRRSYSVATLPGASDLIEFAASYVKGGQASELLFNLQPGDCLTASGPFGRLVLLDETVKRYIFIATGTGITPYRAMLPSLLQKLEQDTESALILQGTRAPHELLYRDDFVTAAKQTAKFSFVACYSREQAANPKAYEQAGRVTQYLTSMTLNPEHDVVYLCGNPNMIDEAYAYLKALDFPNNHIRREKYISSN